MKIAIDVTAFNSISSDIGFLMGALEMSLIQNDELPAARKQLVQDRINLIRDRMSGLKFDMIKEPEPRVQECDNPDHEYMPHAGCSACDVEIERHNRWAKEKDEKQNIS